MIGYNKAYLLSIGALLDEAKFSFVPQDAVMRATFYSVITGSIETRLYDRELVSFLFIYYVISKKNTFKYTTKSFTEIIEGLVIHELNRGLYDQRSRKSMLMLPGIVPAFISDSLNRVGKDDFVGALCNFLIYHDKDLEEIVIGNKRLKNMLSDKSIFKQKFTDFGELLYGSDNNWAK